jgi:hypothetical protein
MLEIPKGKSGYGAGMLRMQMNNHAERWRKQGFRITAPLLIIEYHLTD